MFLIHVSGEELKSSLDQENKEISEEEEKPVQQEKKSNAPINQNKNPLAHPDDINAAFSAGFERSSSVRSDGAVDSLSKESPKHQRICSEPIAPLERRKSSGDHHGLVKLEAYQKWRISGRKGQPPAKLKISQ